jgi:hypothetical protein
MVDILQAETEDPRPHGTGRLALSRAFGVICGLEEVSSPPEPTTANSVSTEEMLA